MTHDVLQLREALEREAADVGSAAELRARLTERRPRRRPAAWLLAAASVLAVLTVAGTVALLRPGRHDRATPSGTVAWRPLDAQADHGKVPELLRRSAPPGTMPCRAHDLRLLATDTEPESGTGWIETRLLLRSRGAASCYLDRNSDSAAILIDARGAELPNDLVFALPLIEPPHLLVSPGDYVTAGARWTRVAGRAPDPVRLRLPVGDGPARTVPLGPVAIPSGPTDLPAKARFRAGAAVSTPIVSRPGSLASLLAIARVPEAVRAGAGLRYRVELVNPTGQPVQVADCPTVLQQLSSNRARPVGLRSRLNCHAPFAVRPGERITFAFELSTAGIRPGRGLLTWSLVDADQAVLQATAQLPIAE